MSTDDLSKHVGYLHNADPVLSQIIEISKRVSKLFFYYIEFIITQVSYMPTYLLACIVKIKNWEEYQIRKSHENISKEKIMEKLEVNERYCEILIQVSQSQPSSITEISKSIKIDREATRNTLNWFIGSGIMKCFTIKDGEEELSDKAKEKIGSLLRQRDLRGAALKRMKSCWFYRLTMRGEEFVPYAAKRLGLEIEQSIEK